MNNFTKLPNLEEAWARRQRQQKIVHWALAIGFILMAASPILVLHIVW